MRLLFVCTGNVCRSPVAAGLATAYAAHGLGDEAADVVINSAGLEAPVGRPMDPRSATALARLGGDQTSAHAIGFRPEFAESADLVLTMTRQQRRAVLERTPRGMRRTFTLLEAADLAARADLRGLEFRPLRERARDLAVRLDAARALRTTTEADDILDPIGHRQAVHDDVATTIAHALRPLADVLFLSPPRTGAATNGVPLASLR